MIEGKIFFWTVSLEKILKVKTYQHFLRSGNQTHSMEQVGSNVSM